ncbi:hypothetical protein J2W30_004015 [Variovorax boronicumulans]|uniref:DUF4124 domain-containing protein n=1 Tax=Variovorax boronicumulans TaxID=436515 RepID=UPI00278A95A0|nr:DUF4124 domain-containing protein [Variovorax boronicumulans]MDQ0036242.1 hypothetical protein [Variovorax boronicumulans]MDQ0072268.1 hypothetical protein [Variovorax boronicumulans]
MVRWGGLAFALGLTTAASFDAAAQHSIYKCVQGGKVVYSNEPCPDAKKIEIKQTKGVNYEGRGSGNSPKR